MKIKKIFILIAFLLILNISVCDAKILILIDKAENILKLKKEEEIICKYKVGLGIKSLIPKEKKNDFLTPEGIYKIIQIRPSKNFLYFLEINYPNLNDLALSYYKGLIKKEDFIKLLEKIEKNRIIKNSPLGCKIGIHGGGAYKIEKRNGKIYKNYHWTKGCIALNNKDLLKLLKYVKIKQKVIIVNSQKGLYEFVKKLVYPTKVKALAFFEGELYLKLNYYTFYQFRITEKYKGFKKLVIKKWVNGILKSEIKSNEFGDLTNQEIEKFLKILIINNGENLLPPCKRLEIL